MFRTRGVCLAWLGASVGVFAFLTAAAQAQSGRDRELQALRDQVQELKRQIGIRERLSEGRPKVAEIGSRPVMPELRRVVRV